MKILIANFDLIFSSKILEILIIESIFSYSELKRHYSLNAIDNSQEKLLAKLYKDLVIKHYRTELYAFIFELS